MYVIVSQLFEELDTGNTGRITEDMFKELLHRFVLVLNIANLCW